MAGSKEKLEEYMRMPMGQIREELFDGYKNKLTANKMREQITKDVKVTPAEVRRYFKDLPEDSLPLIPTQVEVQILIAHIIPNMRPCFITSHHLCRCGSFKNRRTVAHAASYSSRSRDRPPLFIVVQ